MTRKLGFVLKDEEKTALKQAYDQWLNWRDVQAIVPEAARVPDRSRFAALRDALGALESALGAFGADDPGAPQSSELSRLLAHLQGCDPKPQCVHLEALIAFREQAKAIADAVQQEPLPRGGILPSHEVNRWLNMVFDVWPGRASLSVNGRLFQALEDFRKINPQLPEITERVLRDFISKRKNDDLSSD